LVEQVPRQAPMTPFADSSEGRPYGMALTASTTSRRLGLAIAAFSVNSAQCPTAEQVAAPEATDQPALPGTADPSTSRQDR
jgi:hypothetical protein